MCLHRHVISRARYPFRLTPTILLSCCEFAAIQQRPQSIFPADACPVCRQPNGASQIRQESVVYSLLAHQTFESATFGQRANEPAISGVPPAKHLIANIEIKGVAVGHNEKIRAGRHRRDLTRRRFAKDHRERFRGHSLEKLFLRLSIQRIRQSSAARAATVAEPTCPAPKIAIVKSLGMMRRKR